MNEKTKTQVAELEAILVSLMAQRNQLTDSMIQVTTQIAVTQNKILRLKMSGSLDKNTGDEDNFARGV